MFIGVAALRSELRSFEFLQIFPAGTWHKGMSKRGRVMAVRGRGGEGLEVVRHKVKVTRESSSPNVLGNYKCPRFILLKSFEFLQIFPASQLHTRECQRKAG